MLLLSPTPLKRGFTLIELLVVISIIGLLVGLGVTGFRSAMYTSRNSRRRADMEQLRNALELYRQDNGVYPYSLCDSDNDDGGGCNWESDFLDNFLEPYLSTRLVDPKNELMYKYRYIGGDADLHTDSGAFGQAWHYDTQPDSYYLCYQIEPTKERVCLESPK